MVFITFRTFTCKNYQKIVFLDRLNLNYEFNNF